MKTLRNLATTAALLVTAATVTALAATNPMATAPNANNGVKIEASAPANIVAANAFNLKATNPGSHVVANIGSPVVATEENNNANTSYLEHAANITNSAGIDKGINTTAKNEVGSTLTAKNATLNPELNPANTRAGTNITIANAGTNTANTALHDATAGTASLNTTTANLTNLATLHDANTAGTANSHTLNATTATIPNAYHAVLINLTNGTIVATSNNTSPGRNVNLINAVYNTNNAGARIGTTTNYV